MSMKDGKAGVQSIKTGVSFLRRILVLLFLIDFIAFGVFVYYAAFNPTGEMILAEKAQNADEIYWPDFIWEAGQYKQRDIGYVDTVLDQYAELRPKLKYFADYISIKFLRITGSFTYLLAGLIILMFVVCEGLIRNNQKVANFENLSSTRFHISVKFCVGALIGMVGLFLFVPNFVTLNAIFPNLLPSPNFAFVDPAVWMTIIVGSVSIPLYVLISNLSGEI